MSYIKFLADVDPESCCRLPLPQPELLDDVSRQTYVALADSSGGSLTDLQGWEV
ncbi:MAG: hypothetical protein CFH41_00310 [Alphaproteobacteria bacterium MarineAlpha11_Bin1]|nr:MAG: hypothetical protein CFH41_00310 [Alphaproteobacteria bacterium MarineAlpha11_Bin1]